MSLANLDRYARRLRGEVEELRERRERTVGLDSFDRYADDPVGFVTDVLDGDPWAAQASIAESVRDAPLTVVRSCNAAGKDWIAARLALWWVYARRGLVLLTGPTERQVREIVMGEVARAWSKAGDMPGDLYTNSLRLGRDSQAGILAFTSTQASRLTGFHAPRVLAVLTEAQGVEDFAWEAQLACATGAEDRVLAVGNPLHASGRFYAVSQPSSRWRALQVSASDHPNLDPDSGREIPGGPSAAFAERIAEEFGPDSGVYRARVEGEFPEDGAADALIPRGALERAVGRVPDGDQPRALGCDVARYGGDRSAIAAWSSGRLLSLQTASGTSTTETARWIAGVVEEAGPSLVVVDEIGLGAGVVDQLRADGLWSVCRGLKVSERASESERYVNKRAEVFWRLRLALQEGEAGIEEHAGSDVLDELAALRYSIGADGRIRVEKKSRARSRLGRSPDLADAAALGFAASEDIYALDPSRNRIWRPD